MLFRLMEMEQERVGLAQIEGSNTLASSQLEVQLWLDQGLTNP